jgi:hypothetical protein
MLQILEKFALIMEKDAEVTVAMLEKELANTAEKITNKKAEGTTAQPKSAYDGVMFQ